MKIVAVGIDTYRFPVPPLGGAERDARAFAAFARRRWRAAQPEIRQLIGRAATKAAALGVIDDFGLRCGRGERILIYWSGHGGQMMRADNEPDGISECLVAHDSGAGAGFLMDWELGARLDLLVMRGALPLVIVDACHSGGMGAGKSAASISGHTGKGIGLVAGIDTPVITYGRNCPYLAACQPNETAYEIGTGFSRRGAFTGALLPAWGALPVTDAGTTWGQLMASLAISRPQTPMLVGADGVVW